ncbi:MAG TPA: hypothetical protein VGW74_04155, partial [Propionibacteriaceae bacterium]|nr:hypothetical protein [Propionibacteriaceae bacterium]
MALVSSTSVAARSPFPCGAKRTHRLHVSPPGSGPRHVEAPMKKSSAPFPVKLSPSISRSAAPAFVTVTSLDGLTVLCGCSAYSRPRGATSPAGCVSAGGTGCTWPKAFEPQQATAPLLRTAQLWESPALREPKVPAGGVARPPVSSPRQASVASFLMAQVWSKPELIALKIPPGGGGIGAPFELWPPQQARTPQRSRAQPWVPPAPTAPKSPGGELVRPKELKPQQTMSALVLTAQLQVAPGVLPASTAVKVPTGATLNGGDWVFRPQQASVLSVLTPQLWSPPALTALKVPDGGVASPSSFLPQQATVPSLL